jgi:oxygen-dependent protoporphyrinogen oxidase
MLWESEQNHGSLIAAAVHKRYGKNLVPTASAVPPPTSVSHLFQPSAALVKRLQDRRSGGGLYSFRGGMQTLPDAVVAALRADPNVTLLPATAAQRLRLSGAGAGAGAVVDLGATQRDCAFDSVFSTIRSDSLADLLAPAPSSAASASALEPLCAELRAVHYASVVVVHVAYSSEVLSAKQKGFGVLVASQQPSPILGITFDSCVFPATASSSSSAEADAATPNPTRLTVMMGGDRRPELNALSDAEIEAMVTDQLKQVLGINQPPAVMRIHRAWRCIPQFYVGHTERVKRIQQLLGTLTASSSSASSPAPLSVLGTFLNGVSVNDCVLSGQRAAANYFGLTL